MMNGICCMRSFHSFHAELIIQEMCCYAHECSHFSISPNPMWQKHFGLMRTSQSIELLQQRTNQEVLLQKSIFLSMINMTFLTNELAILICRGLVHVGRATRIPEARVSRLTMTAFESSRVRKEGRLESRLDRVATWLGRISDTYIHTHIHTIFHPTFRLNPPYIHTYIHKWTSCMAFILWNLNSPWKVDTEKLSIEIRHCRSGGWELHRWLASLLATKKLASMLASLVRYSRQTSHARHVRTWKEQTPNSQIMSISNKVNKVFVTRGKSRSSIS